MIVAADELLNKQKTELEVLGTRGTSGLDRSIMRSSGSNKEDLQLERIRQGFERTSEASHKVTVGMIADAEKRAASFRDEMNAALKSADTQIAADQRILQSFKERRALEADTAPQQRVKEAADIYDKYYAPAVNRGSEASLGFVRSITSLVSASNLLGVAGNNTALNILTMAASFDRMGTAGLALGGGIGVVLAGVGSLIGAYSTLKDAAAGLIGAIVGVTEALIQQGVSGFTAAVKSAADYQQQLAFIAGLLAPTREQFELLNGKVESVAQTTVFGMGKATEAVSELARAGNSLTDIVNKGALDAVVNLAQAANGELNLADAAKSLTSVVGAYTQVVNGSLTQTVDFDKAVNALTGTAQLSRLSFMEVMQAWRQAAPIAASTKIEVQDLGAVIAILANASETGSISGTSLKQVILDLEKPSKAAAAELNAFGVSLFTADGKIRPFRDVIIDMNQAFGEQALATGKVTEEQQKHALAVIFGSRAALAANIITNQGAEAFDRMRAAMEDVKAVDLANIMLLPLNARIEILRNSIDVAGIALAGPFLGAFSDIINKGIELAQSIPIDAIRLFGQAIVAVASDQGLGQLRDRLAELASGNALQFFESLITFGSRIRQAFAEQILPAIESVARRIAEFASSDSGLDQMARGFDDLGHVVIFVGGVVAEFINGMANFVGSLMENREAIQRVIYVAEGLATVVGGVLLASFVAVAVPMLMVIEVLEHIGQTVDPVLTQLANLATGTAEISSAVETSFLEMSDSAYYFPAAVVDAAEGVLQAYDLIAQGSVALAEAVVEASDAEADGVIAATNDMVQGQAEGWDATLGVTKAGVEGVGTTIGALKTPFDNLTNAANNVSAQWATALDAALTTITGWINAVISSINSLLSGLANNPLFQAAIGQGLMAPINPIQITLAAVRATGAAVSAMQSSWEAVNAAVDRVGRITVPEITRQTRASTGELRGLLDGLGSVRDRSGAGIPTGGRSTDPGQYPGKDGGGGGGGGGKGGGGKGAGVGPEGAYNRAIDQAEEFSRDLAEKIQKAGQQALEKLEDIGTKFRAAMLVEAREYAEKFASINTKANEEQQTLIENFNQSRAERTRRKALDDALKLEAQTRTFNRQDRDNALSDAREAEDRQTAIINRAIEQGLSQRQEIEARGRSRLRQDEDTDYARREEDTENHLRKLEDLQKQSTARQTVEQQNAIRGGLTLGFSAKDFSEDELEKRRLARSRANEDKNTARARGREDEDIFFGLTQQAEADRIKNDLENRSYATTVRRRTDDRARQRTDAIEDTAFTERQAMVRQSLEDKIEVEGIIRRQQKIEEDRKDRIKILDREHAERNQKIKDQADLETRNVLGTLNNQLQDVERTIRDKAPEIIKTGGEAMEPIMEAIVQNLRDQMDIVYNAAYEAREQLGLAVGSSGAQSISETVIDSMADAISTYTTGMVLLGQAAHNAAAELFNAIGQEVPKEPIPITTPGLPDTYIQPQPKTIQSIPNNNGVPIPSTSSVIAPSASGETVVNNYTTYQVDANYGATQSPASIALDISAIAAIGR